MMIFGNAERLGRLGMKEWEGGSPAMAKRQTFIPAISPPREILEPALWFAFQGNQLLVRPEEDQASVPCALNVAELGLTPVRQHYLGRFDGRHCYAVELTEGSDPPAGMIFNGLRQIYERVDEGLFRLAGLAFQIVDWDRTHQFCGRCGSRVTLRPTERAKECLQCGLIQFPRLSPAIIVLIERGSELLLARPPHFPPGRYSVIAGFVETGETLEEAVAREVTEEVDLEIANIRYFGSQPWPFPHSLMIGFTSTYAGGEISLKDSELEDARWFNAENLPLLPGKISIARQLIDWFLARHGQSAGSPARGG